MNSEISTTVMINLPLDKTWEKLRDFSLAPNYVPNLTHCDLHEGPTEGIGASRRVYQKGMFLDESIIHWEEKKGFIMRLHKGDKKPAPFKQANFRYKIKAVGQQTELTMTMTYQLAGGPFGRLMDMLILKRYLSNNIKTIAGNIKRFYETGKPVNPAMATA